MSPEQRRRIIVSGEATAALVRMGIDTTGDDRTAIEILNGIAPETAQELSRRAETLLAMDNEV